MFMTGVPSSKDFPRSNSTTLSFSGRTSRLVISAYEAAFFGFFVCFSLAWSSSDDDENSRLQPFLGCVGGACGSGGGGMRC